MSSDNIECGRRRRSHATVSGGARICTTQQLESPFAHVPVSFGAKCVQSFGVCRVSDVGWVPCAFRIFHIFANCRALHFNDCHFSCSFWISLFVHCAGVSSIVSRPFDSQNSIKHFTRLSRSFRPGVRCEEKCLCGARSWRRRM